jgi:hypothetical protein
MIYNKVFLLITFLLFNGIMLYPIAFPLDCRPTFCIYYADYIVAIFRILLLPIYYIFGQNEIMNFLDRYSYYWIMIGNNALLVWAMVRSSRTASEMQR